MPIVRPSDKNKLVYLISYPVAWFSGVASFAKGLLYSQGGWGKRRLQFEHGLSPSHYAKVSIKMTA